MKRTIAAIFVIASFSAIAANDLTTQLQLTGILCNSEVDAKETKICLEKAKAILISNNACTDKIESLLSDVLVCDAQRAWLLTMSDLYDRAPSNSTHIDLEIATKDYSACAVQAYNFCK